MQFIPLELARELDKDECIDPARIVKPPDTRELLSALGKASITRKPVLVSNVDFSNASGYVN